MKDKYKEPITIRFPNLVARVYCPILSQEEREERMKHIHRATVNLFKTKEG